MDRSIQPSDFQLSAVGGLRADLPVAMPLPARTSGELRISRTSGGASRVLVDDERPIPVLRHADGASRISGSHAAPRVVPRSRSAIANRALNVAIAGVAILVLAPVFVLVAILVRLTSPGPILYTQTRVGIDRRSRRALALYDRRARDAGGSVFTMYKFRSMRVDAEGSSGAVWAIPNDPRATPVGRILRKTRLDELPQLFNVLKGDMNIVGPRPERPTIVAQLRKDISEYGLRHRAKPGITGLAQINHAYDQSLDDVRQKVRYDLEYLRRQSVAEDVRIMLKTVPVMLFKRGGW
jgi:lipopolysaccharide/colanic/teichoic acid biosynthesis glycosyltransferase